MTEIELRTKTSKQRMSMEGRFQSPDQDFISIAAILNLVQNTQQPLRATLLLRAARSLNRQELD